MMAESTAYLHAIVDMGSNGIRFSISDLSPPTARNMPTIYQDRAGISLYDAQYSSGSKAPIPNDVIQQVCHALLRFKRTCADFSVPPKNIRILATEATRESINSLNYRQEIKRLTEWNVEMLSKDEEGRIGAMGVASSLMNVNGLVMDLGGGSTQLSWVRTKDGDVDVSRSVSLPFGAAALLRRMNEAASAGPDATNALKQELQSRLLDAYRSLDVPLERERSGLPLFLSGGGFRGWGYVLMATHHINPYPVSIINGFCVTLDAFQDTMSIASHVRENVIHNVSDRRASQVPAVAFLVAALTAALPQIAEVRFCQGGVREGALFSTLASSIRAEAPLETATRVYAPPSAERLVALMKNAVPSPRSILLDNILNAACNLLYAHTSAPKENRPSAALRCTTSGLLAGVHGLSHEDRAALALLLCERWGGDVPPTDQTFVVALGGLVGPELAWWTGYVGRVAQLIGEVYPAGVVADDRVTFVSRLSGQGIELAVKFTESTAMMNYDASYAKLIKRIERTGKKKNWDGGWGMKVDVVVE